MYSWQVSKNPHAVVLFIPVSAARGRVNVFGYLCAYTGSLPVLFLHEDKTASYFTCTVKHP